MKWHFALGISVILLIPILCLTAMAAVDRAAQESTRFLSLALEESPENAQALAQDAQEAWDSVYALTACIWDHSHLDEITLNFLQMETQQDQEDFQWLCRSTAYKIRLLTEGEKLKLWNIF